MNWVWLVFGIQALLMAVDEGYFHRRRGLPRWERIGHPIDTASVLLVQGAILFTDWSVATLVVLAVLSTLMVTKDEWIHHKECEATETWLHSLLFVIHPVYLGLWIELAYQDRVLDHRTELTLIWTATLMVGLFQILYWNLPLKRKRV